MTTEHPCYTCRHRGTVPGSVHSSCTHPQPDTFEMNMHDIGERMRQRWFSWPVSFDPNFIIGCSGHAIAQAESEVTE